MNFLPIRFTREKEEARLRFEDGQEVSYPLSALPPLREECLDGESHEMILGVRGEHLKLAEKGLKGEVNFLEALGSTTQIFFSFASVEKDLVLILNEDANALIGEEIHFAFEPKRLHFFDKESGLTWRKAS